MAADFVEYSGKSNTGFRMKTNEDYILFNDTEFGDDFLFACIADGAGSQSSLFRPASIAAEQIEQMLKRIYKEDPALFSRYLKLFMREAFYTANNILIGFKLGDEESRYGFATTMTCAVLSRKGVLTYAHVGNTRLYLLRDGKVYQLTVDHTEAQRLVEKGVITEAQYYTSLERLSLYNGLGIMPQPQVDIKQVKLKANDVLIMTSDGIHYSYPSESFPELMLSGETIDAVAETIIETALSLKNFPDNCSVNVIWYPGNREEEE